MPPLTSEEEMDTMSSGDESDAETMYTEILESIRDGSQSHPSINIIETRYKICDCIKLSQTEWTGALLSMKNTGNFSTKCLMLLLIRFQKLYQC